MFIISELATRTSPSKYWMNAQSEGSGIPRENITISEYDYVKRCLF
jgi:hypothetical protein